MDGQTYPFRDKIKLSDRFQLVCLHNSDYSEKLYQVCQKTYTNKFEEDKNEWFVRAQFMFTNELIKYLSSFDFDEVTF